MLVRDYMSQPPNVIAHDDRAPDPRGLRDPPRRRAAVAPRALSSLDRPLEFLHQDVDVGELRPVGRDAGPQRGDRSAQTDL